MPQKDKGEGEAVKFPLFIDITGRDVLVVGAGNIGCRRIKTLLMFGARVSVISEHIADKELISEVSFAKRSFDSSDIENRFMVIAATDKREVNHLIAELCREKNIYVSVADSPRESSFFFPAVCVSDTLSVGIVSDGEHHSLVRETAAKIRGELL